MKNIRTADLTAQVLYAGPRNFATWKKPQQTGYLGHFQDRLHEAFDPPFPGAAQENHHRNFREILSIHNPRDRSDPNAYGFRSTRTERDNQYR